MDLFKRVINSVGAVASDSSIYFGGATSVVFAGASIISSEFPFVLGDHLASATDTGGIWSVYNGTSYELIKKVCLPIFIMEMMLKIHVGAKLPFHFQIYIE